MKKLLLLTLLLPLFCNAQSNYKPGFVVDSKGDTLHGAIDYKEWGQNPSKIQFKNSQTGMAEELSVKNTKAFSVTGLEYYQRFALPISQDEVEISKIAHQLDTTTVTDTVFLKINATGKYITLYSYTDGTKSRFYVLAKGDALPQELIYHVYYNSDEASTVKFVTRFRLQLQSLSQQYNASTPGLTTRIGEATYKEPDLVKIVQQINGSTSIQYSSKNASGVNWFAGIGVNFSNAALKNTSGTSIQSTPINSSSVFPKISGGLDFFENKDTQALQFRAELSATMNQYNYSFSGSSPAISTSTLNIKQLNAALSPQIIYNVYNTAKLKFFLDGGAGLNFSSYNNYALVTKYASGFADNVQDKYPALSSFWISFILKAGVVLNEHVEINACYMPSSSLTKDNINSVNVTSFQVGVNYLFR